MAGTKQQYSTVSRVSFRVFIDVMTVFSLSTFYLAVKTCKSLDAFVETFLIERNIVCVSVCVCVFFFPKMFQILLLSLNCN